MNLTFNAEWPLTQHDRDWLRGYVIDRLRDCALEVRMAYPILPTDPIGAFKGSLQIELYAVSTPWGSGGNYQSLNDKYGFYSTEPKCAIHVVWPLQYEQHHTILEYEGRAFWAHMISGKGVFGHPVDSEGCPFVSNVLKPHIARVYQTDPARPPDIRLRHVSNLEKDL